MKTIKAQPDKVRYRDLKPGETFDACGYIAIKTSDGRAVVLCDGNYVQRDDNDVVHRVKAAVHWLKEG